MIVLFYRRQQAADDPFSPQPPPDLCVRLWKPADDGPPPAGSRRLSNYVWWAFARLGVFAGPGFAELSIWRDERMLHRLIVTPRWRRFPFMERNDLQLGDLWTCPDARGQGLARLAVMEAHRRVTGHASQLWYLVEADNDTSIRLAQACGYSLAGAGRRTRPFGLKALGRFMLETPTF